MGKFDDLERELFGEVSPYQPMATPGRFDDLERELYGSVQPYKRPKAPEAVGVPGAQTPEAQAAAGWAGQVLGAEAKKYVDWGFGLAGLRDAAIGGVKEMGSSLGATVDLWTQDQQDLERLRTAPDYKTPPQQAFGAALEARKKAGDETLGQGIKNVAGAAWQEPEGAIQEGVAQTANMAPILGGMWAGAKIGAALYPPMPPLGAVVGAAAGSILGAIGIETGGYAKEHAKQGKPFDQEAIGQLKEEGAIKGAVTGSVDLFTMGVNRLLFGIPGRVANQAALKVLAESGVNVADKAAVAAALQVPVMRDAAREAAAAAMRPYAAGWAGKAIGATAVGNEIVGEGVGEYAGEWAAGRDPSMTEAVLESVMSAGMSGAELGAVSQQARKTQEQLLGPLPGPGGEGLGFAGRGWGPPRVAPPGAPPGAVPPPPPEVEPWRAMNLYGGGFGAAPSMTYSGGFGNAGEIGQAGAVYGDVFGRAGAPQGQGPMPAPGGGAGVPGQGAGAPQTGPAPGSGALGPKVAQPFRPLFETAAAKWGVPVDLLAAVADQETGSSWKTDLTSPAGAHGLMQFMPGTAKRFEIDPRNPAQSIDAAAHYLQTLYKEFGSWELALAGYNAGEGNVRKHKGIPPFEETQEYVVGVMRRRAKFAGWADPNAQVPPSQGEGPQSPRQTPSLRPGVDFDPSTGEVFETPRGPAPQPQLLDELSSYDRPPGTAPWEPPPPSLLQYLDENWWGDAQAAPVSPGPGPAPVAPPQGLGAKIPPNVPSQPPAPLGPAGVGENISPNVPSQPPAPLGPAPGLAAAPPPVSTPAPQGPAQQPAPAAQTPGAQTPSSPRGQRTGTLTATPGWEAPTYPAGKRQPRSIRVGPEVLPTQIQYHGRGSETFLGPRQSAPDWYQDGYPWEIGRENFERAVRDRQFELGAGFTGKEQLDLVEKYGGVGLKLFAAMTHAVMNGKHVPASAHVWLEDYRKAQEGRAPTSPMGGAPTSPRGGAPTPATPPAGKGKKRAAEAKAPPADDELDLIEISTAGGDTVRVSRVEYENKLRPTLRTYDPSGRGGKRIQRADLRGGPRPTGADTEQFKALRAHMLDVVDKERSPAVWLNWAEMFTNRAEAAKGRGDREQEQVWRELAAQAEQMADRRADEEYAAGQAGGKTKAPAPPAAPEQKPAPAASTPPSEVSTPPAAPAGFRPTHTLGGTDTRVQQVGPNEFVDEDGVIWTDDDADPIEEAKAAPEARPAPEQKPAKDETQAAPGRDESRPTVEEVKTDQTKGAKKGAKEKAPERRDFLADYLQYEPRDKNLLGIVTEMRQPDGSSLKGTVASHILGLVADGYVVAMTTRGPALVNSKFSGFNEEHIGKAGMRFANWLMERRDAVIAAAKKPEATPSRDESRPTVEEAPEAPEKAPEGATGPRPTRISEDSRGLGPAPVAEEGATPAAPEGKSPGSRGETSATSREEGAPVGEAPGVVQSARAGSPIVGLSSDIPPRLRVSLMREVDGNVTPRKLNAKRAAEAALSRLRALEAAIDCLG